MRNSKHTLSTLLLALASVVFLSGCVGDGSETLYNKDVITITDYTVDNMNPYEGSLTSISFMIQNNAEFGVAGTDGSIDTEVNFFSIDPFEYVSVFCEGGRSELFEDGGKVKGVKCIFDDLPSLDLRHVYLTLQAPELPEGLSISPTVSYRVSYDYIGMRKADVPLIDGITRTKPLEKAAQSDPSLGPIELEFEPPVGSSHKEGNRIIKEYWGVIGRPFEVKMRFRRVGSSSIGVVSPVTISAGDLKLEFGDEIKMDETRPCHFYGSSSGPLFSDRDIVIPGGETELICNFIDTGNVVLPEMVATIMAEFEYNYAYVRTETFTIESLEAESSDQYQQDDDLGTGI